jgi:hypothetical protein
LESELEKAEVFRKIMDIEELCHKIDKRIEQLTIEAEDQIFELSKIWPIKEIQKAYKRFRELKKIGLDEAEILKFIADDPEIFPVKYIKRKQAKEAAKKAATPKTETK